MKLYLFYDVFIDYTGGIAGAIAKTRSEAIDIIVTQYEKDNDIIKNIDKKKLYHHQIFPKIKNMHY
jgi:hypothetical protein